MSSAAISAMALLDGDADAVRRVLGNTGAVNAALLTFALSRKRYEDAAVAWDKITPDEKRTKFSDTGKALLSQLADAKHFAMALRVAQDTWEGGGTGPSFSTILNGDFETPIRLKDARLFDWQIGPGAEPQIGVSDGQKHGGSFSLYMTFNSMQAGDLRSVSQTIAVGPGESYTFEVFCRAELKGSVAWEIVGANDGKTIARTPPVQTFADWTNIRTLFTVPAGTDGIIVRLARDGCRSSVCPISGKVWFDDLSLAKRDIVKPLNEKDAKTRR